MEAIAILAVIVAALVALDPAAFRSGVESRPRGDDDRNRQLPA